MLPVVILAGGLGTRMRPRTLKMPKTLLPVCGRPFAHHQLTWLQEQGVERVVYSVGLMGDQIRDFVGDGSRFGLDVSYVDEGDRLLGTAGALRFACDVGAVRGSFTVLYGDSFLNLDLQTVEASCLSSGLPALMTVFRNGGRWDRSNVIFENDRVVLYDKAAEHAVRGRMEWIDYGLAILTSDVICANVRTGESADLAEVMHRLSVAHQLAGHEAEVRFYEIGSPEGLEDLEAHLSSDGRCPPVERSADPGTDRAIPVQ
jgi:NDP-sugar pyrophosphorylase family protein